MPPDQFLSTLRLIKEGAPYPNKSDKVYPYDGVLAQGKLGPDDWVVELCVWVVQHAPDGDAAATEMTTSVTGDDLFDQTKEMGVPDRSWTLPLATVSTNEMEAGHAAFALAIGLIGDGGETGPQQMLSWGQTVFLAGPESAPAT